MRRCLALPCLLVLLLPNILAAGDDLPAYRYVLELSVEALPTGGGPSHPGTSTLLPVRLRYGFTLDGNAYYGLEYASDRWDEKAPGLTMSFIGAFVEAYLPAARWSSRTTGVRAYTSLALGVWNSRWNGDEKQSTTMRLGLGLLWSPVPSWGFKVGGLACSAFPDRGVNDGWVLGGEVAVQYRFRLFE